MKTLYSCNFLTSSFVSFFDIFMYILCLSNLSLHHNINKGLTNLSISLIPFILSTHLSSYNKLLQLPPRKKNAKIGQQLVKLYETSEQIWKWNLDDLGSVDMERFTTKCNKTLVCLPSAETRLPEIGDIFRAQIIWYAVSNFQDGRINRYYKPHGINQHFSRN